MKASAKSASGAEKLRALGSARTKYKYESADKRLLEAFPSPFPEGTANPGKVVIRAPEFTSLCPKTGQPDFATIVIDYTPAALCVESKSLKLYLGSYRNVGMFHEACVQKITEDLVGLLDPQRIRVVGEFSPRGGISFWPEVYWYKDFTNSGTVTGRMAGRTSIEEVPRVHVRIPSLAKGRSMVVTLARLANKTHCGGKNKHVPHSYGTGWCEGDPVTTANNGHGFLFNGDMK